MMVSSITTTCNGGNPAQRRCHCLRLPLLLVLVLAAPAPTCSQGEADEHALARRGMEMLRESFRAEAEGRVRDALYFAGQMPQDAFALFRQGKLLLKLGDLRNASGALVAAARADPHIPSLLSYVAFAQWQLGDAKAGARTCGSALNISLLDFRAVAILLAMPVAARAPHVDILSRAAAAAADAHQRGGHAHHGEQAKTCGAKFRKMADSLTMVSSANSLYFQCLSNLVGSIQLREPSLNISIYDMGFDALEHLVASSWERVTVVQFPFADYPPHVSNLRNYAWKPLVYQHALRRHRSILYQVLVCVCVWVGGWVGGWMGVWAGGFRVCVRMCVYVCVYACVRACFNTLSVCASSDTEQVKYRKESLQIHEPYT